MESTTVSKASGFLHCSEEASGTGMSTSLAQPVPVGPLESSFVPSLHRCL